MVREDEPGDQQLTTYLVERSRGQLDLGELRDYLNRLLPNYMVPSLFVILGDLPLTLSGKVDRKALPAPGRPAAPATDREPPRNSTESRIAEIWAEVLRRPWVGIHDNFFALGGHSLMATQVLSWLHQIYDVDLPMRTIFERPTVAALAERIDALLITQSDDDALAAILAEVEGLDAAALAGSAPLTVRETGQDRTE
jgi:acyl carrier protein